MYKIEEIKQLNGEHIEKWQVLWKSVSDSHFFNSPAWFVSYLNVLSFEKNHVFFCYQNEKLCAVLPFVETKKFGVKVLANISNKFKFLDRCSLLFERKDKDFADLILNEIGGIYNLFLAEVEESHVLFFGKAEKKVIVEFSTCCPCMSIPREDVLQNLPKKQKSSLLNRWRKNKNDLLFKLYRSDLKKHLETIIDIEKRSYKKKKNTGIFDKKEYVKLYRSLVENAQDMIGIGILYFKEKPIAHRFGYFFKNTFMSTHIAFDNRYRKIGPGKILLFYCLECFVKMGIRTFDFSVGNGSFKKQFADSFPIQYNLYYSKNRVVMLWWSIVIRIKKLAKQIKLSVSKNN